MAFPLLKKNHKNICSQSKTTIFPSNSLPYWTYEFKTKINNNGFPNFIVDTEIKHFINKIEQHNIDIALKHKQSINLYNKKHFHYNYKIYKHVLNNLMQKMFSLLILPKKIK